MSDWWATVRIFPPSPLEPGISFLNHLSLYSILLLSTCNPSEGIPVPPQLVEKVVYVDMKALEEEAAVSCSEYGDMNGSSSWAGKCLTGDDP